MSRLRVGGRFVNLAVGADLVEIRRIARLYEQYGSHFSERVFTLAEMTDCGGQAASLAARWAVKEAVSKALGTGFGPISYREIEVIKDTAGQPSLRLSGSARALAAARGLDRWSISIAHDGGLALAFVVALQSSPDL